MTPVSSNGTPGGYGRLVKIAQLERSRSEGRLAVLLCELNDDSITH
jgi:hypothetical protein